MTKWLPPRLKTLSLIDKGDIVNWGLGGSPGGQLASPRSSRPVGGALFRRPSTNQPTHLPQPNPRAHLLQQVQKLMPSKERWFLVQLPNSGTRGISWHELSQLILSLRFRISLPTHGEITDSRIGEKEGFWRKVWNIRQNFLLLLFYYLVSIF